MKRKLEKDVDIKLAIDLTDSTSRDLNSSYHAEKIFRKHASQASMPNMNT